MPGAPRRPTLVLVAHGSPGEPQGALRPVAALAQSLSAAMPDAWAGVEVAFLKQAPTVETVLGRLEGDEAVLLPLFAGEGYFTRTALPAAVAASGYGGRVHIPPALGTHPRLADVVRRRVAETLRTADLCPEDVAVLLIGHGASRPTESAQALRTLAETLKAGCGCRTIAACFLEEAPFVENWLSLTDGAGTVVAISMLMAEGRHGRHDIPPLFGLESLEAEAECLGPNPVAGRQVWFWRSLTSDPTLMLMARDTLAPYTKV